MADAVAPRYGALPPSTEKSRLAPSPRPPADRHYPVAAAACRHRGGNGLALAKHHVGAVPRRLHPHPPRTLLGLASNRNVLGDGPRRPAMPHEARMIEAVAARHIVGMALSECVKCGAIGMAHAGAYGSEQQCETAADDIKLHEGPPSEPG
jgi:hypothetical protein